MAIKRYDCGTKILIKKSTGKYRQQ